MSARTLLLSASLAVLSLSAFARDMTFKSTAARTHLLELYTSEGCSSCPPAERWLTQLQQSPRLWKDFVPVAFHVDYWDNLGWPDRFAAKAFTTRQRALAATWHTGTIYTPGFVLDGAEWSGRSLDRIPVASGDAGILTATVVDPQNVTATFHPSSRATAFEANIAILGFDLSVHVKAGENSGRELLHDFVVLSHEVKSMRADGDTFRVDAKIPPHKIPMKTAVAVWITEPGNLTPIQAVGGEY